MSIVRLLPYVLGAGFLAAVWWHGNTHGRDTVHDQYLRQAKEYEESLAIAADELGKAQRSRDTVTKTVVRRIYVEKDGSGCADSPALNGLLDAHKVRSGRD